ncbi:MAG: hypothetical protein IBX68_06435 [Dehalococcoidia bacterium]|nr:hypothetical protein [Dehalococcoidia bacterium]
MRNKSGSASRGFRITDMPSQKMAVVHTIGDPNKVGPDAMRALYGAVYKLKFDLKKRGMEFRVLIDESGHGISGMHEEEYLTRPTAKVPKTVIRYPIRVQDAV